MGSAWVGGRRDDQWDERRSLESCLVKNYCLTKNYLRNCQPSCVIHGTSQTGPKKFFCLTKGSHLFIYLFFKSRSHQSRKPSAAFAVWLPVDSNTAFGGKPHYSWASVGGGEFPFPTSFSACRSQFTVQRKNGVGVERPHLPTDLFTSSQLIRC